MDFRQALAKGSILSFPGIRCEVGEELGRGSNAIVYEGAYADAYQPAEKHRVLIKELFPFHREGGITRDETGMITCAEEARPAFETHRHSFETGNRVHLRLLRDAPDALGGNLNTFEANGTLYTLLAVSGGVSLAERLRGETPTLRQAAVRMLRILEALMAFHHQGLLHLDIAPDNILLIGEGERERALLIDYNSCMTVAEARANDGAVYSVKQGYTAPEVRSGRTAAISLATDLYSASAVFYRMLSGAPMTPIQMIRGIPPEVGQCACLRDAPETVRAWTRQVLARGLAALPARRYQTVEAMSRDLRELVDRIDGVGVTHWALWEAGRRQAERMIADNPALEYLRDAASLFPSRVTAEAGADLADGTGALDDCLRQGGALLTAPAGMGKTTALLRLALEQSPRYTPASAAAVFVPLHSWQPGEAHYVTDSLLGGLRFKPDMGSYADARKALMDLLDQADAQPVYLLADGLNEAGGETSLLLDELRTLARLRAVRLLVTSRTEEPALELRRLCLAPLREEDVSSALGQAGLLAPESADMRELLRTPMMLSMFIRSARAEGRQPTAGSREELLRAYLEALKTKETAATPEDTALRWQVSAAVDAVLPALSYEMDRKGRALTDAELLPAAERCYRRLDSRTARRVYPDWIGRTAAIRGGAKSAEDWYGLMAHDLLWKRLGLLIRDGEGRYQVVHQVIGEYLAACDAPRRAAFRRTLLARRAAVAALCLALAGGGTWAVRQWAAPAAQHEAVPYDGTYADIVMNDLMQAYIHLGIQYADLAAALGAEAGTGRSAALAIPFSAEDALLDLQDMLDAGGEVMPWSGQPLNREACERLLSLPAQRSTEYALYLDVLAYLRSDARAEALYGADYLEALTALADTDARITAQLYWRALDPHLTGTYADGQAIGTHYQAMLALVPEQNKFLLTSSRDDAELILKDLYTQRGKLTDRIDASGVMAAYERWKENEP